jgi:hypothetical protein
MLELLDILFLQNTFWRADMGALIMTKGTKRLVAHYNEEFDAWIDFYRGPTILSKFRRGGANINIWNDLVQTIQDSSTTNDHTDRPDHLTLVPKKHRKHQNLEARWKFFLQTVLTQSSQNKLADHLHTALTGRNIYIVFDVRVGPTQDVILTSDVDDGDPIARITMVITGPMVATSAAKDGYPPDLDP